MTFLTISKKITFAGMFFTLAGIMMVASIFFYVFMPETKGKTLEEMETLFEDKPKHIINNNTSTNSNGNGNVRETEMARTS